MAGSVTAPDQTAGPPRPIGRREERAVAFFGVWMMTGLFIDGWAHQAQKPETFFSPWHGILYSGFVTAVTWFAWQGFKSGRGINPAGGLDRLTALGFLLFGAAGIADGIWHQVFGVEADLEALVSPSHLALFFGGFLMVSSPIRLAGARQAADGETGPTAVTWGEWLPQGVTLMLSTALIGFFTLYLSPFGGVGGERSQYDELREHQEVLGIASVLVFNTLLVGALIYALRRWRPPFGFGTLLFGGVALGMTGLNGFDGVELALPALVAGLVVDTLIARSSATRLVVALGSFVLWGGYFLVAQLSYGIVWSVELWAGSIVLAVASAPLMAALMPEPSPGDSRLA
ncbi:MAG TPA: hypothetical protein VMY88_03980 [Acidimicrobiales bacterium]|nr:hypothetical protein [Acidimicrobiales bacterium]